MDTSFRIGTSGWSYPHWRGPFYPEDLAERDWLAYYAQRFPSVEINSTFYRLPSKATLEGWCGAVPDRFRFAVKASRYITHMKKLKDPQATLPVFLDRIAALGERLGPVLFQLPPRWRVDRERLERFLDALPGTLRCAFELRDESWHTPEIFDLLEAHRAALCVFQIGGQQAPERLTADLAYIRLHGPKTPYAGRYGDAALRHWAGVLKRWRSKVDAAYCYFDNDADAHAPEDAQRLMRLLAPGRAPRRAK